MGGQESIDAYPHEIIEAARKYDADEETVTEIRRRLEPLIDGSGDILGSDLKKIIPFSLPFTTRNLEKYICSNSTKVKWEELIPLFQLNSLCVKNKGLIDFVFDLFSKQQEFQNEPFITEVRTSMAIDNENELTTLKNHFMGDPNNPLMSMTREQFDRSIALCPLPLMSIFRGLVFRSSFFV